MPKRRWTRLRVVSLSCAALGAWVRVDYALFHHHLRHRASSDALAYLERAFELLQRGAVPSLPATIWPPGTSALWAVLSAMDPSQQLSAAWNAAASILVMPLTAAIAGLLAGSRAGWIALAIAALHPGFIHYDGFALAEQPFQLAIAVAIYLTLSALVRLESDPQPVRIVARAPAGLGAPAPAVQAVQQTTLATVEPAPAESVPAGNYIEAEVVTPEEARGTRRGRLAPPTPGGGSAQGKWFGRFQPTDPAPSGTSEATRKGFMGRERGAPVAASAPAAAPRRSAFADRRVSGPLGRPPSANLRPPARDPEALKRELEAHLREQAATEKPARPSESAAREASPHDTRSAEPAREHGAGPARDHSADAAMEPATAPDDSTANVTGSATGDARASAAAGAGSGRASSPGPHGSTAVESGDGGVSNAAAAALGTRETQVEGSAGAPIATAPSSRSSAAPATADSADRVTAVDEPRAASSSPTRRTSRFALTGTASLWIAGAAMGCSWALAALVRPNALPVATVGALGLLIFSRRTLPTRAASVALGAVLAGVVVLGAAAHRCTATAAGRFCLVSNNVAMNAALGQAGPVYGLEFRDPNQPELATAWVPPSLLEHGYKGLGKVPASVYDAPAVFSWVAGRFAEDPLAFVVRAVGNAFDLFNLGYWPDEFGRYAERSAFVLRQAWSAAVFIPALFALCLLASRVFRSRRRPAAVFVLGALAGLLLGAALSLGEARYRIPFDGLLIALASALYAGAPEWSAPEFVPADRLGARHFMLWSQALALSVIAVIGLTHPDLNLGLVIPQRMAALPNRSTNDWATAADFAAPRATGALWNAQGNYVWKCTPDCGELRIRIPGRRRARHVNLSVDHNDRYRVLFYRDGQLLTSADVPPATGIPTGLQTTRIAVPQLARSGIDAIGVQPLYGDGGYSLGHLILE